MKRLSGTDAMLLYSEAVNVPMHTLKIAIIEPPDGTQLTVETVRKAVARHLPKLEAFRWELVETPHNFHRPVWREVRDVDLEYHVRPYRWPSAGRRDLDDVVADVTESVLDRSRPLWEMYVVDGLADGRCALITKVHHALADGLASANLLGFIAHQGDGAQRVDDHAVVAEPHVDPVRQALRDHARQLRQVPDLLRYTAASVGRMRRSARKVSSFVQPATPPATFMNHRLPISRRFATASLPFADVKRVSKKLDCTVNDLVLAMSAGAVRALLLRHDGSADAPVVASVPICIDTSPNRLYGNKYTGLQVVLPVDVDDPLSRVRTSREAAVLAKESHTLLGPELAFRWFDYLPVGPVKRALGGLAVRGQNKVQNLMISNVPGPRERVVVDGVTIADFYSVGPLTPACGLNITVWSYADRLSVSVLADGDTLTDAHEVTEALKAEFDRISGSAEVSGTDVEVQCPTTPESLAELAS